MKRTALLSLLLALLSFLPAMAQGPWGVKASFDINAPGKWKVGDESTKMFNSGLGFSVGAVYSHYFNDNIFLEPSLSFFYDTYSTDVVVMEGSTEVIKQGIDKFGLRLPVVFGYTFDLTDDFAVSVFTGPELDYSFGGGWRIKDDKWKDDLDGPLFGSEWGMQRRLGVFWKGGLGVPFSDWRVDFEAVVGISDMIVGPASCRENRYSFSLTRYF